MRLSNRALSIAESETLRLASELAGLRRSGQDVVSFLEGEPDLPVPEPIQQATIQALLSGQTRYSNSSGLPELKALIVKKLEDQNKIKVADENMLIANGAKQALYDALQALCDQGDEVIICKPYWVTFPEAARLAGATPVFVETLDHQLDLGKIAAAITHKTKAIILNSPNNPTGAVYSKAALKEVATLAVKHDFFIISDEAYEHLVYDGLRHESIAALGNQAAKKTITIQTFSKSFSMTGFRVGYLAAHAEIVRAISRLHGHVTGNVCTFAQHGAIAALALDQNYFEERRAIFQKRRDLAFALALRSFDCAKPQGAFYLFADVRRYLGRQFEDSAQLAAHLLRKGRVAVVPGAACGMEGYLRISFSTSEENICKGFERIEGALCRLAS